MVMLRVFENFPSELSYNSLHKASMARSQPCLSLFSAITLSQKIHVKCFFHSSVAGLQRAANMLLSTGPSSQCSVKAD
jgi:hypothetical protein